MKQILVIQDTECIANSINILALIPPMFPTSSYTISLLSWEKDIQSVNGYFHQIITVSKVLAGSRMHLPGLCDIAEDLYKENHYDSILIPATRIGRMLAPRLAKRLRTGLVADVVDIAYEGEKLLMIRTAYSGNMLAGITSVGDGPIMMSVHPDAFTYTTEPTLQTEVHHYEKAAHSKSTVRLIRREKKPLTYDIRKSGVLISGGEGVKRHFTQLQQLADALGGEVSASRKLVDQGIAPRSIQVGQSGKIVSPRLYLALGINGAIQHVEGLQDIETIIAVNLSAKAPICSLSDIVVEGDAKDFIDKLLDRIQNSRNTQQGES